MTLLARLYPLNILALIPEMVPYMIFFGPLFAGVFETLFRTFLLVFFTKNAANSREKILMAGLAWGYD